MTIEEVKTRFVADVAKYKKDIQDAQKILAKFVQTSDTSMNKASTAEHKYQMALEKTKQKQLDLTKAQDSRSKSTQNLGSQLAHTARNMMTLYYSAKAVAAVFQTGIDYNRFTQNAEASFRVMTKSATQARNIMAELRDFAVESPLSFEETVESARQLMAYGFQTKELVSNMEMLGTVALATGHSLTDVSYVYGTLKTQGRAYSRDLMQFAMRGIPIYEELAAVMGVNTESIKKMTEEGKIGFREVERAFQRMTGEGGRFYGMIEERMKTLDGATSQFKDSWQLAMGALTESLVKTITTDLLAMAEALNKGVEGFRSFGQSAVWFFQSLGDALNLLSNPLNVVWDKIFGTDFSKMQSRGLNSKAWRDLLGVDAVIEAEKAAKKLADTRNYLNNSSVLQGEKQRGPKPIPIVDPEEVEKAKKLMDDLLASLEKYRDEYRRIKAQQMVDGKKNIYALAQLELDLDRRKIQEEFKGQTDLMNQALAYADLIHEHKIVQIYKEEQERRRLQQAADLDEAVGKLKPKPGIQSAYDVSNAMKKNLDRYDFDSIHAEMLNVAKALEPLRKQLVDQTEIRKKLNNADMDESAEIAITEARIKDLSTAIQMLEGSFAELEKASDALVWQAETDAARDAARPIPGVFDGAEWDLNGQPIPEKVDQFGVASAAAQSSIQGTEVGQLMSGADPLTMAIMALAKFAMSIENVMKVLNPFTTILEAMRPIVEPLVNGVLQPLVNLFEMLGEVIGQILTPFLALQQIFMSIWYITKLYLIIPLQMLGAAFTWLYDSVIVPVGNAFIKIVNGVIDALNKALGFLGVNIRNLEELATTSDMANKKLKDAVFIATFEEMVRRLNAAIEKQITTFQDLYQVGAISGSTYTAEVDKLNAAKIDYNKEMYDETVLQHKTIEEMSTWIKENLGAYMALTGKDGAGSGGTGGGSGGTGGAVGGGGGGFADNGLIGTIAGGLDTIMSPILDPIMGGIDSIFGPILNPIAEGISTIFAPVAQGVDTIMAPIIDPIVNGVAAIDHAVGEWVDSWWPFAAGTASIPSDMVAQVHQGEGIVPRTFMDAIRAGELTLSGGGGGNGGGSTNYYITVEGSVMKENDMTDSIARKLEQRMRRGYA